MNVYPFIEAEEEEQRNVSRSCDLLEVSRSAYYVWAAHIPSPQDLSDLALGERIAEIHTASRGTYGAPRVHAELADQGIACGRKRVARIMRRKGWSESAHGATRRPRSPIPPPTPSSTW
jgi:hypothetical protein